MVGDVPEQLTAAASADRLRLLLVARRAVLKRDEDRPFCNAVGTRASGGIAMSLRAWLTRRPVVLIPVL